MDLVPFTIDYFTIETFFLTPRELKNESTGNTLLVGRIFFLKIEELNASSSAHDENPCVCKPQCFYSPQSSDAINWKISSI